MCCERGRLAASFRTTPSRHGLVCQRLGVGFGRAGPPGNRVFGLMIAGAAPGAPVPFAGLLFDGLTAVGAGRGAGFAGAGFDAGAGSRAGAAGFGVGRLGADGAAGRAAAGTAVGDPAI